MIKLEELRIALKQLKSKTGTFEDIGQETIPISIASIDYNGQQAVSFRLENRTSDPESPVIGQIWLRTDI